MKYRKNNCFNPSAEYLLSELMKQNDFIDEIKNINPMKTKVNMFELNSNDITNKLINECELLREQI